MNPRNFGGSVWLLLFGTATVLLIGAFARFDTGAQADVPGTNAPAAAPAPALPPATVVKSDPTPELPEPIASAGAPTLPSDLSPGLGEIIKLAQAHIAEDTLLAYITNSGQAYNPSADEVLYLSDLGISEKVIAALFKKAEAPTVTPAAPATPPAAPEAAPLSNPGTTMFAAAPENMIDPPQPTPEQPVVLQNPQDSYFYNDLSPYGSWLNTPDGYAWQPSVAVSDPGWMPYRDRGHWALTDDGWFWDSDYTWGWAAFHYGRWNHDGRFGWVWVPGNVWGPAWVAWRGTEGFAGWAPLPPGVYFQPGVGLFAGASIGGPEISFGVSASWFTFVPHERFLSRNLGRFAVAPLRGNSLFKASAPVNNYAVKGPRLLNIGISADVIAAATRSAVPKMAIQEASAPGAITGRGAKSVAVYRPHVTTTANRGASSGPAKPMMINQTPRPATVAPPAPRATTPRPAAPASDYASQSARPTYTAPKAQTGFSGNMFRPAPTRPPPAPSSPAPLPTFAARTPSNGGEDFRRMPNPSEPAPAVNYPSYNQRGFGAAGSSSTSSSSATTGSAEYSSSQARGATGYSSSGFSGGPSAPSRGPAMESRGVGGPSAGPSGGGGGQSGGSAAGHGGGGSSGGGSQSSSSKTGK